MSSSRHGLSAVSRVALASLIVLAGLFAASRAGDAGEILVVSVTPLGVAASARPLPVGAMPRVSITVRNVGAKAIGRVTLTARLEELQATDTPGWRIENEAPVTAIPRVQAGEQVERTLRLRIERAPLDPAPARILVEARTMDGVTAAGEAELQIADCAGAYRERLSVLRAGILQAVRAAAEDLRKPDPDLPGSRLFPAAGARTGGIAAAERLAASFAARRGADGEMASERFRFLILRWTSELNAYARQSANPGLCANIEYQIAGYRRGLSPITQRIEAIRTVAADALEAARGSAAAGADADLHAVVRRAIEAAGLNADDESIGALGALAAARAALAREGNLRADETQVLALAETAAWLAETDRRAQALAQAIERVFSTVAAAHRDGCICAF